MLFSKNLSTKTVVQNVRIKMLAEKPFNKTTIKNDRTEMMPKKVSVKTVGQNIRTEKLAGNASEKTTIKMIVLECCPNTFLGIISVRSFLMVVLLNGFSAIWTDIMNDCFCGYKNSRSKGPYWFARKKCVRRKLPWKLGRTEMLPKNVSTKTVVQNVRTKMLAEEASAKTDHFNHSELLPKTLGTNSCSKCLYQNAIWESVRENYQ